MLRKLFLLIILFFIESIAFSCTMEDSYWQEVEQFSDKSEISQTYAISDALYLLKNKFEREMIACNMATGPVAIIGIFDGKQSAKNNEELYNNAKLAAEIIWKGVIVASASEMPENEEDYNAIQKLTEKYNGRYNVILTCSDFKETVINFLDYNFQYYAYLKFVYREELKLHMRVADSMGMPVFLDEIEVSPTIIIQPYLSPLGGYIYVFEKNNTISVQVSFGTLSKDGSGEHQVLILYGNNQETAVPPYEEFKSDLEKKVEKEHNQYGNMEFYKRLMMEYDEEAELNHHMHDVNHQADTNQTGMIASQTTQNDGHTNSIKQATNESQLMFAIKNLDLDMLKDFLKQDKSGVNVEDESGLTPLQAACKSSFADMVKLLVENGGNPSVASKDGKTALHHAVDIETLCLVSGNSAVNVCPLSIPETLIKSGADINAKDINGMTPLHYAVKNGLVGVAAALVKAGADVNIQDKNGNSPSHSFGKTMSGACIQVLLHNGANLEIKNNDGLTPYEKAMKEANAQVVNVINDFKELKSERKISE